jgi:hypothetical protein
MQKYGIFWSFSNLSFSFADLFCEPFSICLFLQYSYLQSDTLEGSKDIKQKLHSVSFIPDVFSIERYWQIFKGTDLPGAGPAFVVVGNARSGPGQDHGRVQECQLLLDRHGHGCRDFQPRVQGGALEHPDPLPGL